ncbi:MAG: ATP-binding protein [Anditalea sp.]
MEFCNTYFRKNLDQLTEEDLIIFFNSDQKETQHLEVKSSGETNVEKVYNKTLRPAICSFLNSTGGILIYGAPREDRKDTNNPDNYTLRPYSKGFLGDHDSIIRKISDGITPMPIGFRLKEVEVGGGYVAIFEIQESKTKPHQTDNLYQIRIDGQKKIAPHYLIEAMMKQITFPDIRAFMKVIDSQYLDLQGDLLCIKLELYLINFSEFLNEKNVRYRLKIDGPMAFDQIGVRKITEYEKFEIISFGEPVLLNVEVFGKFAFMHQEKTVALNIIFNGESSPSKITVYQMKIRPNNLRGFLVDGIATLEVDNLLFSEHQLNLGISHREALKKSLGIDF